MYHLIGGTSKVMEFIITSSNIKLVFCKMSEIYLYKMKFISEKKEFYIITWVFDNLL